MTERQPSSRSCFVCGRDNPLGLKIRWETDRAAGEVRGRVIVPEPFNGYPGVVHGGIVTAILDEALARSVLVEGGFEDLLVTAKLEVVFRRPTPTGQPLLAVGRLLDRRETRARAHAELRLGDGTVAARAEGLMAKPPPEVAAGWAAERAFWRVADDEAGG